MGSETVSSLGDTFGLTAEPQKKILLFIPSLHEIRVEVSERFRHRSRKHNANSQKSDWQLVIMEGGWTEQLADGGPGAIASDEQTAVEGCAVCEVCRNPACGCFG